VEPIFDDLAHLRDFDPDDYVTSVGDTFVEGNPDTCKTRHGPTNVEFTDDFLELDIGQAFQQLSEEVFSRDFISYMSQFKLRLSLRVLRTQLAQFDNTQRV
jgi:hypothetical protein